MKIKCGLLVLLALVACHAVPQTQTVIRSARPVPQTQPVARTPVMQPAAATPPAHRPVCNPWTQDCDGGTIDAGDINIMLDEAPR